jgi:hypothetical protein
MTNADVLNSLIDPTFLTDRETALSKPCPIPDSSGIYAWYFKSLPNEDIPSSQLIEHQNRYLLYVGICPSEASRGNRTIRQRIREHYGKTIAEGSTLRYTLGTLLRLPLAIRGKSKTFGDHEETLDEWMQENALVTWQETDHPWTYERYVFETIGSQLPLNLSGNPQNPFRGTLKQLRKENLKRARESK